MTDRRNGALWCLGAALALPGMALAHPDTGNFAQSAFVQAPEIVDCTLENGTEAQCYRLTVGYLPEGLEIGPFCPATLDDAGGIWDWTGDEAGLYRVDGDFLRMLDALGYRFFDEDGTVHVVDNAVERPTVDHACINVSEAADVEITMLLPVDPVVAETPSRLGVVNKVGVALDGVPIFSDAPSVQMTGHMPALDLCGGHIDPGGWYHWHATSSDIETVFRAADVDAECGQPQDPTALFGYAFDGFALYGSLEPDGTVPVGLDVCQGHAVGDGAYHYHGTVEFPNLPPCLVGVQAQDNFVTTASAGIGALNAGPGGRNEPPRGGPGGLPPGFDTAAEALGITPEALMQATDQAGGPRADLSQVARALGVDEDRLRAVLPPPPGR